MAPIRPGWSREKVFSAAWVEELRPAARVGQIAEILIFRQSLSGMTYDPGTGGYEYPDDVGDIYSGLARVQPLRVARNVSNNAADTIVQAVRFQIDDLEVSLRVGDRVRVENSELNRNLESFEYIIQEIMNSSNPFEQTFEAFVDTEVRHENGQP